MLLSINDIQKYAFNLVIFILYVVSFSKKGIFLPLFKSGKCSIGKRIKQVGGNIKDYVNKENINTTILTAISLVAIILMRNNLNTISIIFIFASILMIYAITGELLFSLTISLILGSVIISFTTTGDYKYTEQFEDKSSDDKPKEVKGEDAKTTEEDSIESDSEKFEFDKKSSFLENYKSLTKEQVNGLNKDTVELMKTQQQLIDTLKNMGPVLKDGKNVLDTFKSYFGDDMMNKDMGQMLKNAKNAKI
jgi:hypothetical protein